jgi:hypothetical protein
MTFLFAIQSADVNSILSSVQDYIGAITNYVLAFVKAIFPVMIYVFTFQIIVRKS